jgi:hypothetical protein
MTVKCKHGHLYTEANTRWVIKVGPRGQRYQARQCKTCARLKANLKYRTDAEHREKQKARGRALYEKRRDATVPRRKRAGR